MKNIFIKFVFVWLCCTLNFSVCAQTGIVNVTYHFEYINDLANKNLPYVQDMILSLTKKSSRYSSLKAYKDNDPERLARLDSMQTRVAQAPESSLITVRGIAGIPVNNAGILIHEEILKDFTTKTLKIYGSIGIRDFRTQTTIPEIDWEIQAAKKEIGGYSCQKAIGKYGGRTYEVWFTPELPFHDGPWKLSGLPGLILEAHDQKKEIVFSFKNITKSSREKETTDSFIKDELSVPITSKKYDRLKAQFIKNPEAIIKAQYPPNTPTEIINVQDDENNTLHKIKQYNPMELK